MKENIAPSPHAWRWRKSSYSEASGNSACVELGWRKSSYSEANGNSNCMELAPTLDAVRDSKNASGPTLSIRELPEFIRQLKAGLFTH